nr:retrovirus-related Pol polyprotein from transposon TNT 1-94 [Tanacetum cinerariifolium]
RPFAKEEEKAFHTKGEPESSNRMRGRDIGSYRGRGRGRTLPYKLEEAKFAEENDEEEFSFMTSSNLIESANEVWYVDSGCSNHMTGDHSKFKSLDESVKSQVRLGDNKQLHIEGQGTAFVMKVNHTKQIKDVHFAPSLAHNLISVGQLMQNGCSVLFDDKNMKKPFPVAKYKRAYQILELIHADLCGPMRTESLAGSKYFLLFTDDYSRMSWVYFLQVKSETFEHFKKFKALVEKQTGENLKALRTYRGGEFLSKEFIDFCDEHGIKRELTAPYTPEQNGVAERKNKTVVEMTRSMMKSKGLPNSFWAERVTTSVYLLNISPTKAVWDRTSYEAWNGSKPSGCWKWGENSQSSADIKLNEEEDEEDGIVDITTNTHNRSGSSSPTTIASSSSNSSLSEAIYDETSDDSNMGPSDDNPESNSVKPRRSERGRIPRRRFPIEGEDEAQLVLFSGDPSSAGEAMGLKEWREAMELELQSIERNQTWVLVNRPEDKNIIGLKWIFKTKYLSDGSIERRKARLVKANEKSKVYRLKMALYGLKQAPRACLYVDDMIYTGSSLHLISEFKVSMKKMFDMTDLGELRVITPMNPEEKLRADDGTGTMKLGIWFCEVEDFSLKGYRDSDYGGSVDDGKSTTGNCFMLESAAISWSSKKQETIAISVTEA